MTKKTYKREVAVLNLILFWTVVFLIKDAALVTSLIYPVFLFAAVAFGLDWYAPNGGMFQRTSRTPDGRGSEHSS